MVSSEYVPDTGDLVWLDFSPQTGREQAGRRPAIILSPKAYNEKAGLVVACPITSRIKGYPFEVVLSRRLPVQGAILADQVRSLDWRSRKAQGVGKLHHTQLEEVRDCLRLLIGL